MSDFLQTLEADLVEAMRRRAEPRSLLRRLLFPHRRLQSPVPVVAVVAALVIAVIAGVRVDGIRDGKELAPGTSTAYDGTYARSSGPFQLLLAGGRYTLLRCSGADCAFDIGDRGVRGGPKVRTGTFTVRGTTAVVAGDATCRAGGAPLVGRYRMLREGDRVLFSLIEDRCRGRLDVLDRGEWTTTTEGAR